jgi:hypothetical protein
VAKPFTRVQALENRAFLTALRRTGNVRLACRELGLKHNTMQNRRRAHPAFAVKWDAALVVAQAALNARLKREEGKRDSRLTSGRLRLRGNDGKRRRIPDRVRDDEKGEPLTRRSAPPSPTRGEGSFRTQGGEPVLRLTKNGKLQLQRAQAGKLTTAAEQAFLAALSVTCNVKLAAAAVGAAEHAFYRRKHKDPAFAREMRLAIQQGYDALELALLESSLPESFEHDEWRSNDPPAIPPTSANQALQLMYLHQKEARLTEEPYWLKKRRGEPHAVYRERLAQMAEERERRAREEFGVAEAERMAQGLPAWGPAGEAVRVALPEGFGLADLAQVTGWSRADPDKPPHDDTRALFGGWRIEDMEEEDRGWGLE